MSTAAMAGPNLGAEAFNREQSMRSHSSSTAQNLPAASHRAAGPMGTKDITHSMESELGMSPIRLSESRLETIGGRMEMPFSSVFQGTLSDTTIDSYIPDDGRAPFGLPKTSVLPTINYTGNVSLSDATSPGKNLNINSSGLNISGDKSFGAGGQGH